MNTAIRFGMVGFVSGLAVAVAVTGISLNHEITPQELHLLWPAAVFGLDFSGWADGNAWHFLELLLAFLGNGVIYALLACSLGWLLELLRHDLK